jgi:hypothetical protein
MDEWIQAKHLEWLETPENNAFVVDVVDTVTAGCVISSEPMVCLSPVVGGEAVWLGLENWVFMELTYHYQAQI